MSSSGKGTVMLRTYRILVAHIPHEVIAPSERVRRRMLRRAFRNRHSGVPGLVFLASLSLVFAPSLIAQTAGMGTLVGRVIDASGTTVANATVTATSADIGTNAKRDHRDGWLL